MTGERAPGFTVRVEPVGAELTIPAGGTVFAAARRAGYRWPTSCDGDGDCTLCWMEVVDGAEHLTGPTDIEVRWVRHFAGARLLKGPARLACQARVEGPVTVRKRGVVPPG